MTKGKVYLDLEGYITEDPKINTTKSGVKVASFNVGVNYPSYKNKEGTEIKPDSTFIKVVCWRGVADYVEKCAKKGASFSALCTLKEKETKQEKDGQTIIYHSIEAEPVKGFLPDIDMVEKGGVHYGHATLILKGKIIKDPELRKTIDGTDVLDFTVMTLSSRKKDDGEYESVSFLSRGNAWGETAKWLSGKLSKGTVFGGQFPLKNNNFETTDDNNTKHIYRGFSFGFARFPTQASVYNIVMPERKENQTTQSGVAPETTPVTSGGSFSDIDLDEALNEGDAAPW